MPEYLVRGKSTRRESGMGVRTLKIQFMDFAFEQNVKGDRKPMQVTGEELERVTHFKCLVTSTEEQCCMETEITV